MRKTIKIAVCGSGLAGLTAAYLLSTLELLDDETKLEVHLFEKAHELGMDVSSMSAHVPGMNGKKQEWRIDVPMRLFQGGNFYKHLIALYGHLGVKFMPTRLSYSFSSLSNASSGPKPWNMKTILIYNGSSGRAGLGIPSSLLSDFTWTTLGLLSLIPTLALFAFNSLMHIYSYIKMLMSAFWYQPPPGTQGPFETLQEWTERTTPTSLLSRWVGADVAWRSFIRSFVIPVFATICTATSEDIWAHPVAEILEYIRLTFLAPQYVAFHGVRDVVSRLSAPIAHIHLSSPITSIQPEPNAPGKLSVTCSGSSVQTVSGFSHIIFATQANQAKEILSSYLSSAMALQEIERKAVSDQVECLSKVRYRSNIVINHTDDHFLPDNQRDHRDIDLSMWEVPPKVVEKKDQQLCVSPTFTMATHILPGPPMTSARIYQTTNPLVQPRKSRILSVTYLQRPILSAESKRALQGLIIQETKPPVGIRGRFFNIRKNQYLGPLQGAGKRKAIEGGNDAPGIWICGSYAGGGIPLLEGCVTSAKRVVLDGILVSEGLKTRTDVPW